MPSYQLALQGLRKQSALEVSQLSSIGNVAKEFRPFPGAQAKAFEEFKSVLNLESSAVGIWHCGGRGAGKSALLGGCAAYVSENYPNKKGMVLANVYDQLRDSTVPKLLKTWDELGVVYFVGKGGKLSPPDGETIEERARQILNAKGVYLGSNKMYLIVASAERFTSRTSKSQETGRGAEIDIILGDELTYADGSVIENFLGSLGRTQSSTAIIMMAGTPNRNNPYNWAYNYFTDPDRSEGKKKLYRKFLGSSRENPLIPESWFEMMRGTLTPELYQIEVEGQDVMVAVGRIATYFDRNKHVYPIEYDPKLPIILGFDFNINPAVAVIAQHKEGKLLFLDEVYLKNADTFKSASESVVRLNTMRHKLGADVSLYGDATGRNATANSRSTNWEIVQDILGKYFTVSPCYGFSNPPIVNRCLRFNAAFYHDKIGIDPKCKMLIKDNEAVTWDKSQKDIDKKSDPLLTHLFDAASYMAHDILPFNENSGVFGSSSYVSGSAAIGERKRLFG